MEGEKIGGKEIGKRIDSKYMLFDRRKMTRI